MTSTHDPSQSRPAEPRPAEPRPAEPRPAEPRPSRLILRIVRHEALRLRREIAGPLILATLAVCAAYAVWNGAAWRAERLADTASIHHDATAALTAQRTAIEAGESGLGLDTAGSPKGVAVLPPGPLADFAIGQSDLLPYRAAVSAWERADTIFAEYQLASPSTLFAGRFDLAFVIVTLLPLALLALTYDLLSAEREGGTWPLVRGQPIDERWPVAAKLLVRGGSAVAVVLGVAVVGLLLGGVDADRLSSFVGFAVATAAYAAFWLVLATAVARLGRRSETNALWLGGVWLAFVIVVPGLLAVLVDTLLPVPSRLVALGDQRTESSLAAQEAASTLDAYYEDHPELAGADRQGGFLPSYFAQQRRVEARVLPAIETFESQLAERQRLVRQLSALSPAVATQEAFYALAGSDTERHRRYVEAARDLLADWHALLSPRLFQGQSLTADDFRRLPELDWRETGAGPTVLLLLAASVLGWSIVALLVARRRSTGGERA